MNETKSITPKEGLDLIHKTLEETRQRYEIKGRIITLWGLMVMIAGLAQFILIKMGYPEKSGLAWLFTMVPMFIYTFIVKMREGIKEPKRNSRFDFVWLMAGSFGMITGFFFFDEFGGRGFTIALYLPFCVAALTTALLLRNSTFIWLSVLSALVTYASIFIPFVYHPLVASLLAFLLFFIPGLMLRALYKQREKLNVKK